MKQKSIIPIIKLMVNSANFKNITFTIPYIVIDKLIKKANVHIHLLND
jgi:hypothetical protein